MQCGSTIVVARVRVESRNLRLGSEIARRNFSMPRILNVFYHNELPKWQNTWRFVVTIELGAKGGVLEGSQSIGSPATRARTIAGLTQIVTPTFKRDEDVVISLPPELGRSA